MTTLCPTCNKPLLETPAGEVCVNGACDFAGVVQPYDEEQPDADNWTDGLHEERAA